MCTDVTYGCCFCCVCSVFIVCSLCVNYTLPCACMSGPTSYWMVSLFKITITTSETISMSRTACKADNLTAIYEPTV
jgi:hypothetical protein